MKRRIFWSAAAAAVGLFFFPWNAWAYLDPGAGSMAIQALAAAVFTVAVFFRQIRGWICSLFRKGSRHGKL